MTEPDDPDWGFPQVDPASTELPPDDDVRDALEALSSRSLEDGPYDTGSDAWWRAQAAAQRAAAAGESADDVSTPEPSAPPPAPEPPKAEPSAPAVVQLPQEPPKPPRSGPEPPAAPRISASPPISLPEPPRAAVPAAPGEQEEPEATQPPRRPVAPAAWVDPEPRPAASPLDAGWLPESLRDAPAGPPHETAAPSPPAPPPPSPVVKPEPPAPPPPPAVKPEPPAPPPPPVLQPPTPAPAAPIPSAADASSTAVPPQAERTGAPEPSRPPRGLRPGPPAPRTESVPTPVAPPAPRSAPPQPEPPTVPAGAPGPGVVPPASVHETAEIPPYRPSASDREFYDSLRGPEPVGPRRAMAGALLAVGGVVLGIVLLYAFRHDHGGQGPVVALPTPRPTSQVTRPTPTPKPTAGRPSPATGRTTPAVPAPILPVTVLNNSKVHHLADRSAARFRAGGWPVKGTGNYRGGTISQTTVYYAPGQLGSAQRFAKLFGIPRVRPRFSGLPGSGLTVVLTRDYA